MFASDVFIKPRRCGHISFNVSDDSFDVAAPPPPHHAELNNRHSLNTSLDHSLFSNDTERRFDVDGAQKSFLENSIVHSNLIIRLVPSDVHLKVIIKFCFGLLELSTIVFISEVIIYHNLYITNVSSISPYFSVCIEDSSVIRLVANYVMTGRYIGLSTNRSHLVVHKACSHSGRTFPLGARHEPSAPP